MEKTLVIMESPTKTKAVGKYLGDNFLVLSSEGHIRNLSSSGEFNLGVNLETFEPKYKIEKGKKPLVKTLALEAKKAPVVILATDPDREGEAIAYHLNETLKCQDKSYRVRFNEITKEAILEAFDNKTEIDMNLVRSQEARRMIDRFIGFRLSKLLQKKIRSKSAGRVQSVALKLIVEREKEWNSFISEEYWTVDGIYKKAPIKLTKYLDQKVILKNQDDAITVGNNLSIDFVVNEIKSTEKQKTPPMPFTTSTLLQDASSKLSFASNKTSLLAQQLYEGIKIKDEIKGFITYPRTDSVRLSEKFIVDAFDYITINFGPEYIGKVKKIGKKKNVQDAHEAIRPTDLTITPDVAKEYLTRDQWRLYRLIYKRALGSLMSNAVLLGTTIILLNNNYEFRMTGNKVKFNGYLKCLELDKSDDDTVNDDEIVKLPNLLVNDVIKVDELYGYQHFTKPPNHFSEARLIKKLEEIGVGRPSTYAPIIKTLKERGYILIENKAIKATDKGIITNDNLQDFFSDIINEIYTSKIEVQLDKIAVGQANEKKLVASFWKEFEPRIENAFLNMVEIPIEKANILCPECNQDLVYRYGKYGKFIACSGFPKCRFILQTGPKFGPCPLCGEGEVILKINRRNQKFKACSLYPNCNYTDSYKPETAENSDKNTDSTKLYRINLL